MRWTTTIPLAAAALFALAAAACLDDAEAGPGTELEAVAADEIIYGVENRLTRDGVQEALLRADTMFMWRDSVQIARMEGLTLEVHDEQGRLRATITAERGRIRGGNELVAWGGAVLRIPGDGGEIADREINTEELHFSWEEQRVWSDVRVVMRESGCSVEGDRFTADMSFDDVRIWGTRGGECPAP